MKTKIHARFIIGYANNDHVIYENADLVYEDERILFVGLDYPHPVDRIIEAGNAILSPGFIDLNALGDIDHDILHFQACGDTAKAFIWSEAYASGNPVDVLDPADDLIKNRYAFAQLIRNGITTAMPITSVLHSAWARTYSDLEGAAAIAADLGLRVYLGPSYQSGVRVAKADGSWDVRWQPEKGEAGLQAAADFIGNYDGSYGGLVRAFLAPERIETITPELLQESKRLSDALDCPIRLHAAQGQFEYGEIFKRHALSPIAFLDSLGFLGSRTLIPHAIYTSGSKYVSQPGDHDLELLGRSGTTIIHCPLIMARHGMALDSHARYRRQGVNIAMGTDTFPPDMIENIRWASILAKVSANDPCTGSPADFFRAATLAGAQALGRQDLGRLAPGALADMILIDLNEFQTGQIDDPIKTMIFAASGRCVTTSIIHGRTVMWNREIPGQDLEWLQNRAQECFLKIKKSYTDRDYLNRSADDLFPSSFRIIGKN